MGESIKLLQRKPGRDAQKRFTVSLAEQAAAFHRTLSGYAPTPLVPLDSLAGQLGVAGLYVKDESFRFGLNAFKVLGGSYCIHRCMEKSAQPCTFVTATDGNHGRGVAWAAARMKQKCVVYLPKGSSPERLSHIRALGAQAGITEWNYDDTVRFARQQAEKNGWVLVQDTSWEGYEQIPAWIMQGYTTMGLEITAQLPRKPTHILLQAGVGAMAGAMCGFFEDYYGAECPRIIIVESDQADCLYRTAMADDGRLRTVAGSLSTIMAGLACGEPCHIGWEQIRSAAEWYASVSDSVAAKGMRVLGNPCGLDGRIISGESGAVTAGLVYELLTDPARREYRKQLGLDRQSVILCISTEGDTDRAHYRKVVWDGAE